MCELELRSLLQRVILVSWQSVLILPATFKFFRVSVLRLPFMCLTELRAGMCSKWLPIFLVTFICSRFLDRLQNLQRGRLIHSFTITKLMIPTLHQLFPQQLTLVGFIHSIIFTVEGYITTWSETLGT